MNFDYNPINEELAAHFSRVQSRGKNSLCGLFGEIILHQDVTHSNNGKFRLRSNRRKGGFQASLNGDATVGRLYLPDYESRFKQLEFKVFPQTFKRDNIIGGIFLGSKEFYIRGDIPEEMLGVYPLLGYVHKRPKIDEGKFIFN